MNIFQTMVQRLKSKAIDSDHLPVLDGFVDIATGGKTDTVSFEGTSRTEFETHGTSSAAVGAPALFNYSNGNGRFRFRTECTKVEGRQATFALPAEITVIEEFGHRRKSYRLQKVINVRWRYAPDGVGYGSFVRGKCLDLSAIGARLDVGRELRGGTLLEMMFEQILIGGKPLVVICELTRAARKDTTGIIAAGIRFKGVGLTEQNAISEFIGVECSRDRIRHIAR